MSFIKIDSLLINLDAIATIDLQGAALGPGLDTYVVVKLQDGEEHRFQGEEAKKLREFFANSNDVHDVMVLGGGFHTSEATWG